MKGIKPVRRSQCASPLALEVEASWDEGSCWSDWVRGRSGSTMMTSWSGMGRVAGSSIVMMASGDDVFERSPAFLCLFAESEDSWGELDVRFRLVALRGRLLMLQRRGASAITSLTVNKTWFYHFQEKFSQSLRGFGSTVESLNVLSSSKSSIHEFNIECSSPSFDGCLTLSNNVCQLQNYRT